MIRDLDEKQQKLLALAILTLIIGIAVGTIAIPLWSATSSYNEQIDALQMRLQSLRQVASRGSELQTRYEEIRTAQDASGHYLRGPTHAVAAADLQSMLRSMADELEVQVQSTQILPPSQVEEQVQIGLRARLRGELPGIISLLQRIETDEVLMFIDNLAIANSVDRRRIVQEASADFDVTLELTTFIPGSGP